MHAYVSRTYVHNHIPHVYIPICTSIQAHTYICIQTSTYILTYMQIHINAKTSTSLQTFLIHTYMHSHIHTHAYISCTQMRTFHVNKYTQIHQTDRQVLLPNAVFFLNATYLIIIYSCYKAVIGKQKPNPGHQ